MLVLYSKIIGLPIIETRNQTKVGEVFELILQKTDIEVSGIVLKNTGLFSKQMVISSTDLIEISADAVLVSSEDAITTLEEAMRLKEQISKGYTGVGQKIYTKSGKYIGKVFDFLVDSSSFSIKKLYTKSFFIEKIIPTDNVISFNRKVIIIKDDFEPIKLSSPAVQTNTI